MALRSSKLGKKRLQRIKEMIDWLEQNRDALRFEALSDFARSHRVTYDTIKQDAYALAYATIPDPKGGFNLTFVPRSHIKIRRG